MNIGLYFGSFNPIHIGHLIIANHVLDLPEIDKVWFVVSPQNPLKKSSTLLNEYDRLHLVRLATEDDIRFSICDIEFKLPKPSYTIDTLTYLGEKYPEHTFTIIIGSDSFQNISKWKNYERLLHTAHFIIYKRPGYDFPESVDATLLNDFPQMEVSSTYIRTRISEGKSIRYLVPEKVFEEIENYGYYKRKVK